VFALYGKKTLLMGFDHLDIFMAGHWRDAGRKIMTRVTKEVAIPVKAK